MRARSPTAGEVDRLTQKRFLALFVRVRFFVAPLISAVALYAAVEGPAWRVVGLVPIATLLIVVSTVELRVFRRHERLALGMTPNLLLLAVGQLTVITCTGGLGSPLIPGLVAVGLLSREAQGNRTEAARRLGIGRATLYEKLARHGIARDEA